MIHSLVIAIVSAVVPPPPGASFDCKKAATRVEKLICADAELSALDGKLAQAYRRAVSISPRPDSLRSDQATWLARERGACKDAPCIRKAYGARLAALAAEKEVTASFDRAPFVSPHIIEDLTTGISDEGDQVLGVCVSDSQGSDRYSGDVNVDTKSEPTPFVSYETPVDGEPPEQFGYRHVGRTTSGVDVLLVRSSGGGGTGAFPSLLLVTMRPEETGMSPRSGGSGDQTLTFRRKRLVIRKLGQIPLGDRWSGALSVTGNELHVGKDQGFFSDRSPSKARVITIDYQP
jgi:uncharacterized protein YecT (DUF1311 family)